VVDAAKPAFRVLQVKHGRIRVSVFDAKLDGVSGLRIGQPNENVGTDGGGADLTLRSSSPETSFD
jgi:hypothetical protein